MSCKRAWHYLLVLSLTNFGGCTDYWWSRGQPPSVADLLAHSSEKLEDARASRQSFRPIVAKRSSAIQESFTSAISILEKNGPGEQLNEVLNKTQENFISLEGTLSVGSRASYSELSGQLRAIALAARQGNGPNKDSLGLLASRSYAFLANELAVPAP